MAADTTLEIKPLTITIPGGSISGQLQPGGRAALPAFGR